jgi:hypothetical protein
VAATLFYNGDSRNQFHMSDLDLERKAEAYKFDLVHKTEAERQYEFTDDLNNRHVVIVSQWDTQALDTIRYGQTYRKS